MPSVLVDARSTLVFVDSRKSHPATLSQPRDQNTSTAFGTSCYAHRKTRSQNMFSGHHDRELPCDPDLALMFAFRHLESNAVCELCDHVLKESPRTADCKLESTNKRQRGASKHGLSTSILVMLSDREPMPNPNPSLMPARPCKVKICRMHFTIPPFL